jgi:hypothetical protein
MHRFLLGPATASARVLSVPNATCADPKPRILTRREVESNSLLSVQAFGFEASRLSKKAGSRGDSADGLAVVFLRGNHVLNSINKVWVSVVPMFSPA